MTASIIKKRKKSGLSQQHLLHFYLSVIRPVLKYCSVVWHHSLFKTQCESLEAIQRRAIRIIYPVTVGMPYIFALSYAQIPSLHARREDTNKRLFRSILHPTFCILSLLPPQRDSTITSRLRSAAIYPRPAIRTKRFTSSVQYFLLNYQ